MSSNLQRKVEMDLKGVRNKNKKRSSSDEPESSKHKKSRPPSTPTGSEAGSEAERCFFELLSRLMPFLSQLVQAEVQNAFSNLREGKGIGVEEVIIEPETEKYKLVICKEIASTIFTNNEIRCENGEPLRVAICDATTNAIICTGPLSSAQVEFFVLDGEYGSSAQQEKETQRTLSDFNKSVLSPRDGKRPLMVGNDQKLYLENGIALIKNLCITDNSSWMKSKKFRLGAIIRDEKILAMFPIIGVAVSQPFRVMDHRGEVNKKHHPPSRDDEVYRLEGIGKDGAYHKNLFLHGIRTVGDFLKAYHEMGHTALRKLLGIKVPKKTWMMMLENAFECVNNVPTYPPTTSKPTLLGVEAFNDSFEKNFGPGLDISPLGFDDGDSYLLDYAVADFPPPLFLGEASTPYVDAVAQAIKPTIVKEFGSI